MSGIEVINAGWGRTGTSSFTKAMELLGYPCYHIVEMLGKDDHIDFWQRKADGVEVDMDEIFSQKGKQYKACCDGPSCYYWKDTLKRYPNAKVVLTLRDAEKWYESASNTIFHDYSTYPSISLGNWLDLKLFRRNFDRVMKKTLYYDQLDGDFSKENVIRRYNEFVADVYTSCPPENLLVFEAKDGWEPLCKFLGKPVPDVPYPNINDTTAFRSCLERKANRAVAAVRYSVLLLLSVAWCAAF